MTARISKNIVRLALVLFVAATLTSCNRGMGCPTFSIDGKNLIESVSSILIGGR